MKRLVDDTDSFPLNSIATKANNEEIRKKTRNWLLNIS